MSLLGKFIAGAAGAGVEILMQKQKAEILAQRDKVLHGYRLAESQADVAGRSALLDKQGEQELEAIGARGESEAGLIEKRVAGEKSILGAKIEAEQPKTAAEIKSLEADAAYKNRLAGDPNAGKRPEYVQEKTVDPDTGATVYGDWVNKHNPSERYKEPPAGTSVESAPQNDKPETPGNKDSAGRPAAFVSLAAATRERYGVDISSDDRAAELVATGDKEGFVKYVKDLQSKAAGQDAKPASQASPMESTSSTSASAEPRSMKDKAADTNLMGDKPGAATDEQTASSAEDEAIFDPAASRQRTIAEREAKQARQAAALKSAVSAVSDTSGKLGASRALAVAERQSDNEGSVDAQTLDMLAASVKFLGDADRQSAINILDFYRPDWQKK
jgi:hypothetical protein